MVYKQALESQPQEEGGEEQVTIDLEASGSGSGRWEGGDGDGDVCDVLSLCARRKMHDWKRKAVMIIRAKVKGTMRKRQGDDFDYDPWATINDRPLTLCVGCCHGGGDTGDDKGEENPQEEGEEEVSVSVGKQT